MASLAAVWLLYPIDVWKVRLQADLECPRSSVPLRQIHTLKTVLHELRSRKLPGLWQKSAHNLLSSFVFFFAYSWLKVSKKRISRGNMQCS
jgi:hypothetical protein